jgi:hypothetical protein
MMSHHAIAWHALRHRTVPSRIARFLQDGVAIATEEAQAERGLASWVSRRPIFTQHLQDPLSQAKACSREPLLRWRFALRCDQCLAQANFPELPRLSNPLNSLCLRSLQVHRKKHHSYKDAAGICRALLRFALASQRGLLLISSTQICTDGNRT